MLDLETTSGVTSPKRLRLEPRVESPFDHALPTVLGQWIRLSSELEKASSDFGKIEYQRPAVVLRPACVEDVAIALRYASEHGIAISARGDAHSAGGQMLVDGGIVIDMTALNRVHTLSKRRIVVDAGISWRALLERTFACGLTPPVLTDWVDVTVGGTLSMGGLGFSSFWQGTQMDHVLELEVVTGLGERLICSPTQNPELFNAVRGTHGQIALIVRATIPLEVAPASVRVTQAAYDDADLLMRDLRGAISSRKADMVHALAAPRTREALTTRLNSRDPMRVDERIVDEVLEDTSSPWVYQLEVADPVWPGRPNHHPVSATPAAIRGLRDTWEMSFSDFVFRIPPLIAEEAERGAAPHPELILWVPEPAIEPLVVDAFDQLDPVADIGEGPVLIFGLRKSTVSAPYYQLPDTSDLSIFFGLLRRAEPITAERVEELREDNENRYAEARQHGAGRYVCDTPPTQRDRAAEFWPQHFGDAWESLCRDKQTYDPAGVFRSSWGAVAPRGGAR